MQAISKAAGATVLAAALIGAAAAHAGTIPTYTPTFVMTSGAGTETFTADTGSQTTDYLAQFNIPQFNSSLGQLTGITVTLSGQMNATGSISNSGAGTASGVGISQGSTVTDNPPQTIATSFGSQVAQGTTNGDNFLKLTSSASTSAAVGTVAVGSTVSNIPLAATFATQTVSQTSNFDPNLIGTGTYGIEFATGEFTNAGGSGGNLTASAATADDLIFAVTYNYVPKTSGSPPIPEPMSLTLIGTGLMGIAAVVRRRRGSV